MVRAEIKARSQQLHLGNRRKEGKKAIREQGYAGFWGMSTPYGSCDELNESQQREDLGALKTLHAAHLLE